MNRKVLAAVLIAGLVIFLLWFMRNIPFCGWDFRDNLWGPANMLVHRQTPYTLDTPYGPYPGVWMPTGIGMFFWLGAFPCDTASEIWLAAELAGFVWLIWRIAGAGMPSRRDFFICILGWTLFPPLWLHIRLGQFSMLFVILMMMAVYLPKAQPFLAFLLALGLTKPQLALLIYPGLLLSVWKERGFLQAARLAAACILWIGLLSVPLFLFYPGWLNDFLPVTFTNLGVTWDFPTLFVQFHFMFGGAGYILWGLVLAAAGGVCLWFWYRKDAKIALLVSFAATPMVTTYASSWDFVLLLPGFFWLVLHLKNRAARAVLLAGMGICTAVQIGLRWGQDTPDGRQWWIPPALILVYLGALAIEYPLVQALRLRLFPKNSA